MSGHLTHRDVEELLQGRSGVELEALVSVVEHLRLDSTASIDAAVAASHVALAAAAARSSEPAAVNGSSARRIPDPPRRRTVFAGLFSSILVKIMIGAMALVGATVGAGAAGVLPDPVQEFVDDHLMGLDLDQEQVRLQDQTRLQDQIQLEEQLRIEEHLRLQDQVKLQAKNQFVDGGPGDDGGFQNKTQTQGQSENQVQEQNQVQTQEQVQSETQTQSENQVQNQEGPGEPQQEPGDTAPGSEGTSGNGH
jgi:hypothetical protein